MKAKKPKGPKRGRFPGPVTDRRKANQPLKPVGRGRTVQRAADDGDFLYPPAEALYQATAPKPCDVEDPGPEDVSGFDS
jgi:hypothetical protein